MYLALYRKWRSRTFDDVIGQEHITTTLKNEVKLHKTAHSYLFTGPRGTGKTSCAKILAMAVNCPESDDGNPCMECETCKGIQSGSILDVLEIDAASNNGVDDVRILREEANYTPAQCRFRVYIIDETHMLSTSAFNALLKIMEEPPEHVKFILATTEVHKVPATILSRCQRFDFGRIKTEDIKARLLYIASHEDFSLEDDAAYLIARLADGGMRDALSILDQCTAFSDKVDTAIVSQASGLVLRDYLFRLADAVCAHRTEDALGFVDELYAKSKDLQRLVTELTEHFRNLMLVKTVKDCGELVKCLPDERERLREQASGIPMQTILHVISALQECTDKIAKNYDKRLCVETTLIRLCSPELDDSIDALRDRVTSLENRLHQLQTIPMQIQPPSATAASAAEPDLTALTKPNTENDGTAVPEEEAPPLSAASAEDSKPVSQEHIQVSAKVDAISAHPEQEVSAHAGKNLPSPISETAAKHPAPFPLWPEVMNAVKEQNPALAGVLSGSAAYTAGNDLFIDSPISFFSKMIKQEGFLKQLKKVLFEKTGIQFRIRIKKSKTADIKQKSPLDELSETAAKLGVEVREK